MKLPALPVPDHLSTLNFEAIQKHDLSLLQLVAPGGVPTRIEVGTGTVTFTASNYSALTTVSHNLGVVPLFVSVASRNTDLSYGSDNILSTSFRVGAFYSSGAITGTYTFGWLAIG